jgi:hypothetical protein
MPLLMTAGAVAAIKANRDSDRRKSDAWRDTSLDDWRRDRDATSAREREAREAERGAALAAGSEEESADPVRQQRLGG